MSDNQTKPAHDPAWDLREAENEITAAVGGDPALAQGLRRHSEAGRNMLQTLLVPSFEKAVDAISEKHTVRILSEVAIRLEEITTYTQQSVALAREGITIGKAAQITGVEALEVGRAAQATGLAALSVGREALAIGKAGEERMAKLEHQYEDIVQELALLPQKMSDLNDRLNAYMAGSKRDEMAALQAEVREMRGEFSPEQRQRHIAILTQMIAEWERTHPDVVE